MIVLINESCNLKMRHNANVKSRIGNKELNQVNCLRSFEGAGNIAMRFY